MGFMNFAVNEPFKKCPITDREVNYNFNSPNPRVDGYEYKIESLNKHTIICITGNALNDAYLSKLKSYKDRIEQMISSCQSQVFTIDTLLLYNFE